MPHVGHRRAPPPVDGLVVVAHHHHLAARPDQHLEQRKLNAIGVLKLIHQQVLPPAIHLRPELGRLAQQRHRLQDEVGKIAGVRANQLTLVGLIQRRRLLAQPPAALVRKGPCGRAPVLRRLDGPEGRLQRCAVVSHLQLLSGAAEHAHRILLVINRKPRRQPKPATILPQQPRADSVKGADRHPCRPRAGQLLNPLPHLRGSLVREGHRKDAARGDPILQNQLRDAGRDDPRLAAARSREDEQRLSAMLHRRTLVVVQSAPL